MEPPSHVASSDEASAESGLSIEREPLTSAVARTLIAKLNAAIHKAMKNPEFIRKMDESGATLIPGTPQEFGKQIEQAMARYARVAQVANISVD